MPKPTYRLDDPFLNEYIFQVILNAPQELKNKLPLRLLKYTHSVERIKRFAERAKWETKFEMLVRLGGAFSIALHPPGWLTKEKLKEIIDNYLRGERSSDVNEMVEKNIFVVTDREISVAYNLMAMNCHNETYMLNRDYPMIATQITLGKKINPRISDVDLIKSVMEDYKLLVKFILYTLINRNFTDMHTAFKARELFVLLYLFLNKSNYVEASVMHTFFQTSYSARVINVTLTKLCENLYVQKFPGKWMYAISGLGIQILAEFVNRVINQTLYY